MVPDIIDFGNDVSAVMPDPVMPKDTEFECKNIIHAVAATTI